MYESGASRSCYCLHNSVQLCVCGGGAHGRGYSGSDRGRGRRWAGGRGGRRDTTRRLCLVYILFISINRIVSPAPHHASSVASINVQPSPSSLTSSSTVRCLRRTENAAITRSPRLYGNGATLPQGPEPAAARADRLTDPTAAPRAFTYIYNCIEELAPSGPPPSLPSACALRAASPPFPPRSATSACRRSRRRPPATRPSASSWSAGSRAHPP